MYKFLFSLYLLFLLSAVQSQEVYQSCAICPFSTNNTLLNVTALEDNKTCFKTSVSNNCDSDDECCNSDFFRLELYLNNNSNQIFDVYDGELGISLSYKLVNNTLKLSQVIPDSTICMSFTGDVNLTLRDVCSNKRCLFAVYDAYASCCTKSYILPPISNPSPPPPHPSPPRNPSPPPPSPPPLSNPSPPPSNPSPPPPPSPPSYPPSITPPPPPPPPPPPHKHPPCSPPKRPSPPPPSLKPSKPFPYVKCECSSFTENYVVLDITNSTSSRYCFKINNNRPCEYKNSCCKFNVSTILLSVSKNCLTDNITVTPFSYFKYTLDSYPGPVLKIMPTENYTSPGNFCVTLDKNGCSMHELCKYSECKYAILGKSSKSKCCLYDWLNFFE